jgi:hypothetical protein
MARILGKSGKPHSMYLMVTDESFGEDLCACLGLGET